MNLSAPLTKSCHKKAFLCELTIGENEPYSMKDKGSYTLHTHGGGKGPNIMFEIRQNEIDTPDGVEKYASRFADVIVRAFS